MQCVLKNPYRFVGLLVGATAKEQERQFRRLKQYLEADQEPDADFSFPTIGPFNRTFDSINDAASKLNLDSDKMNAALFWFYKGNSSTDDNAFKAINEADFEQVINIWTSLISNGKVLAENASAFCNLGTLFLSGILRDKYSNDDICEQGISLKLKFLESDFINEFKTKTTDATFHTTKKELQLFFLNQVQSEVEKSGIITSNKFLEIVTKQVFSAKEDFLIGFVRKPIEQIEKKIEDAKAKRKANKANAVKIGEALFKETSEDLIQLKSILGTSNLRFSSISDKVSEEILQCGIDYFSNYKDSNIDPSIASMDLFRKAKTLAIGSIAKQRCQENTESLQQWINGKPERDKQARILVDFEKLKNLIDEYDGKSETVANGKQLLASASPHLNSIKNVLGTTDELYLGLSTRIASDVQGMCVSEINKLQEGLENSVISSTLTAKIILLKERVDEAWEVAVIIGSMDLLEEFRKPFIQNRNSLSELKKQLSEIKTGSEKIKSSGTQKQTPATEGNIPVGNKKNSAQRGGMKSNGIGAGGQSPPGGSNSIGGGARRPIQSGSGNSNGFGTSSQTQTGESKSNSGSAKRPSEPRSGNSNDSGTNRQTQTGESKSNGGSAKRPLQMGARNSGHRDTFWQTQTDINKRKPGKINGGNNSSGKCYIATMAYGDYDHPQVLVLRQFRDNILKKTNYGRWLIKSYYHYSPKLVEKLHNKKNTNRIIRAILNQFIKLIKLK